MAEVLVDFASNVVSGPDTYHPRAIGRFADDLAWWSEAAREQRARKAPPY